MEFLIIFIVILLIGLVVGAPVYLLRELGTGPLGKSRGALPDGGPPRAELAARQEAEAEQLRGAVRTAIAELDAELGRLREGLRTSSHEQEKQLAQLRDRYVAVDDRATQLLERGLGELRGHLDGELARLRDGVGAAMAAMAARQASGNGDLYATRRSEAIADLYRRLAKVEASLLAVTNPMLLPGEPFSLPAEFSSETLRWENWKEVGDSAFAFADAFNQQRIYLDDATCRDLAAFVAALRERLTTSIYPNLKAKPSEAGAKALRQALERLGDDLPATRDRLERAFRELGRE